AIAENFDFDEHSGVNASPSKTMVPKSSSNPKAKKKKQNDLASHTCFYCHKPSHQALQCPNKIKLYSSLLIR
ncbi:hypothetical protein BGZ46_002882, partial [Entomortierella lignicola]